MQNKCEYKGLFYAKKDSGQKFYEGGAHFKYIDLVNILKKLSKNNSYSKTKKEVKKNSLSQGKNNPNSNNNASTNKSKNKSSKKLLISENKTPINFLINFHKKKINNNEGNKSLKNLNNSHNYNKSSNLGITQFLNLKINNKKNLYNISDLENNSKFSNISRLKEKKISYDNININIKHQPKSRNSQDKRIKNKTKKDNSCLNNNIYDYNDNNYNYFFIEQKIDKIKEKQKNTTNCKYKKIINSQNTNNYLDYFKITKISPRSRGSLNKNTIMLNIRKLKNKNIIQKSSYNIKDNNSITNITKSFIKKKKERLSFDKNVKISKIGYNFESNTTTGEDLNIKNKKNNYKNNKSPILNDSLYKRRSNMTLLTLNKFDESLYKKCSKIGKNNSNSNSKNKIEKNKKFNNNNKILKYINQYIIKQNGFKRQNSRNNFFYSYRNKYILNDLPKKITDNTYNNANAFKKNKNNEVNINYKQPSFHYKMSSRNSIINNDKILKSLEDR